MDDGERALVVAARTGRRHPSGGVLYYVRLKRTSGSSGGASWDTAPWEWEWEGEGDCEPHARWPGVFAGGGHWRHDRSEPPPGPDSRSIHVKVWSHRECRESVEPRGKPEVRMTDEAVLVGIPVATTSVGDMCVPGPPTRLKIRLPEPLGDRQSYDAGVLPLRRVGT